MNTHINTNTIAEAFNDAAAAAAAAAIESDAWATATLLGQLEELHLPPEIDWDEGNCFGAALWVAHAFVQRWPEWEPNLRLVHAEVQGNGPKTQGLRFGHGYLTLTIPDMHLRLAIDYANRQRIVVSLDYYEWAGNIGVIDNKHDYTYGEAIEFACRTRHYGPWELVTRSGL